MIDDEPTGGKLDVTGEESDPSQGSNPNNLSRESSEGSRGRLQNFYRAIGLERQDLRAWAMYDWANSAFATTIMAAVLPIYYADVAADGLPENVRTAYWGYTASIALMIVAIASPLLGACADFLGSKKKFLAGFVALGVLGTGLLILVDRGEWQLASGLFIIANIGFAGANVFYDGMLPHLAKGGAVDRVSTAGYAYGYAGGGLLLLVNLLWIQMPTTFGFADAGVAVKASFVSVAVWWGLFTIPLLRHVKEPPPVKASDERGFIIGIGFRRLMATFRQIRRYKQVMIFLLAFWFYTDGIGTIIKMATIYGREIGIEQGHLIGALLLVQLLGLPCTFAFGAIAHRLGPKTGITICLIVYAGICILGFLMTTTWEFWFLAVLVATVQGGCQALSRSLYASMIPRAKSSEFFAFISVSSKFAGIFGPLLFGLVTHWTGAGRLGILFLILFFVVGIVLLRMVDVDAGRAVALAADKFELERQKHPG